MKVSHIFMLTLIILSTYFTILISTSIPVRMYGLSEGSRRLSIEACRILSGTIDYRTINDIRNGKQYTGNVCPKI